MTDLLSIKKNIVEIEERLAKGIDTRRRQQPDALLALDSIQSRYHQMQTELRDAQDHIALLETTLDGIASKLTGMLRIVSENTGADDIILKRVLAIRLGATRPSLITPDTPPQGKAIQPETGPAPAMVPDGVQGFGVRAEQSPVQVVEAEVQPSRETSYAEWTTGATETARLIWMETASAPEGISNGALPHTQQRGDDTSASAVYETYESFEFRSAQAG